MFTAARRHRDRATGYSHQRCRVSRRSAVPRLPIIEPERVASPPLAIALTDVYRYRLDGRETIGSTLCYVVSFEPDPSAPTRTATLFRGRAWIAADSFAHAQGRGHADGAARTDRRVRAGRRVSGGSAPACGCSRDSDVRQMYEGAAHRTPIHRVLAIDRNEVNAGDFSARQQHAYNSAAMMLRDTPDGYRYLKKDAASETESPSIAGRSDRVRTIAGGVIVDPNISIPLPFAGFSYVDFNFLGTGQPGECLLRRHVWAVGVVGAVASRERDGSSAARHSRSRLLQRSIVRKRPRAVRPEHSATAGRRCRCGCCIR